MPVGFSRTRIANLALSHVGSASNVEDVDNERQNPAANACKTWLDVARVTTLEAYDWAFARRRRRLGPHPSPPSLDWAARYVRPDNCLTPRYIENPGGRNADAVPFDQEVAEDGTMSIVTDLPEPTLVYTADERSLDLASMHFIQALSLQLGILIATEIPSKKGIKDSLKEDYRVAIIEAPVHDARGHVPRQERDSVHHRARR